MGSSWGSSELGSPLLHGSSSWFGGPGDPSLSLELTNEFEGTFVKADAAAESRIAELEGFGSISSSTGNEPLVTIWQFYRPYVTDGKRAENRCAGERGTPAASPCAEAFRPSVCWPSAGRAVLAVSVSCVFLVDNRYLPGGGAAALPPRRVKPFRVADHLWSPRDPQCFRRLPVGGRCGFSLRSAVWIRSSNTQWGSDRGGNMIYIENDRKPNIGL